MQNRVELFRELSMEVVAHTLGSRKINDANGPLQMWFPQRRWLIILAEWKQKIPDAGLVKRSS